MFDHYSIRMLSCTSFVCVVDSAMARFSWLTELSLVEVYWYTTANLVHVNNLNSL